MARKPSYHPRARREAAGQPHAAAQPRWNPEWDPKYRQARAQWRSADRKEFQVNYGAFVARAPARWDRAENWWRKAPHEPQK